MFFPPTAGFPQQADFEDAQKSPVCLLHSGKHLQIPAHIPDQKAPRGEATEH
uniref:Uncharacterized protein n=1 Tax=Anguilla anguilla TaxID=7936 RepID=A0A0E9TNJ4_ANGAN